MFSLTPSQPYVSSFHQTLSSPQPWTRRPPVVGRSPPPLLHHCTCTITIDRKLSPSNSNQRWGWGTTTDIYEKLSPWNSNRRRGWKIATLKEKKVEDDGDDDLAVWRWSNRWYWWSRDKSIGFLVFNFFILFFFLKRI